MNVRQIGYRLPNPFCNLLFVTCLWLNQQSQQLAASSFLMAQMFHLIKDNAVPAAVMRSAAKGALSLPATEMLQILVHLTGNPVFGQEAAMTLAGWDTASAVAVLSGSDAPEEVIGYFLDPKNYRLPLMPAILENPRVGVQYLAKLAHSPKRELVAVLLASSRVRSMPEVLRALLNNPHLTELEAEQLRQGLEPETTEPPDPEAEAAHEVFQQEHSAEIEAEEGTAFELTGAPDEPAEASVSVAAAESGGPAATTGTRPARSANLSSSLKVSTLVRLSRMNVAERVKQGFLGNKEERTILIRDSARIVQNSVLASPKLSEPEVETFAAAKNVSENVLREIARNRRFIKIYAVVRSLVNNPRCPLDVSLTLVKNLLVMDLKSLQGNKNVPDTLRKVATKLYKDKSTPAGQRAEH